MSDERLAFLDDAIWHIKQALESLGQCMRMDSYCEPLITTLDELEVLYKQESANYQ